MKMKINEAIDAYIAVRDKKAAKKKEQAAELVKYDAVLKDLEGKILQHFNKTGVDSAKTANGTAYKSTRSSTSMADWSAFVEYVKANEAWELLEHRAAKKAVEQYREVNDSLPPGVNWSEEIVINVRRS